MGQGDILLVGVAGGSGSGKTTIARILVNKLGHKNVTLIPHDSYYRDLTHLSFEERGNFNFDHPDSLETELLVEHVKALKRGEAVDVPLYDFETHLRCKKTMRVEPTPVVLLEGILLLHNEELRELLDIKIYVDTEPDIRFIRRLKRDTKERGRSVNDITSQYLTTVRPMHMAFVEPTKNFADLIIPEGGYDSNVAIDIITSRLQNTVDSRESENEIRVKQIENSSNNKSIMLNKTITENTHIAVEYREEIAERMGNM